MWGSHAPLVGTQLLLLWAADSAHGEHGAYGGHNVHMVNTYYTVHMHSEHTVHIAHFEHTVHMANSQYTQCKFPFLMRGCHMQFSQSSTYLWLFKDIGIKIYFYARKLKYILKKAQ